MSNQTQMRDTSRLARAWGLVTILALVVAPVCTPLCAAQVCSQSSTSVAPEAPCHLAGMMHGDTTQIRAVQNCGGSELLAAVLTSSIKNDALQASRAAAFDNGIDVLPQALRLPRLQQGERPVAGSPPPRFSSSSLFNGVLKL